MKTKTYLSLAKLFLVLSPICISSLAIAQPGGNDPTFNIGTGCNSSVYMQALQTDGKIIIIGSFTNYNNQPSKYIVRINPDGSKDDTFNAGIGANAVISAFAIQSDGKIVIVGDFTTYNGLTANRVARLNADGSLDESFRLNTNTGADNRILTVTLQSDNKIIIGGRFLNFNGTARNTLARLHSDGLLDLSYIPPVSAEFSPVYVSIVQLDGKLIIGAYHRLLRINTDGTIDNTFIVPWFTDGIVYKFAFQADGKILMGGNFTSPTSVTSKLQLARVNTDGSWDDTLNAGGSGLASSGDFNAIAIQADNKILISTTSSTYNGKAYTGDILRINPDGKMDTTFITSSNNIVLSIGIQSDKKITVGGYFTNFNAEVRGGINRISYSAPATPISKTATNVSPDGFTANWNSVTGATSYLLYVRDENAYANLAGYNGKAITSTSEVVQGTSRNHSYSYYVIAVDVNGKSKGSNIINTTTYKLNQTISFPALPVKYYGDTTFTIGASASSGLPILYTTSDTTLAKINGQRLTIKKAGSTTIYANQPGNDLYSEAQQASVSLTINPGNQIITFPTPPFKVVGDPSFDLGATSNSPNPILYSTTSDKITINGIKATPVKAGKVTVKADQNATDNFNEATTSEQTFCIYPAKPEITSVPESFALKSSSTSGNQWYKDNEAISGAVDQVFEPQQSGTFTVVVTTEGCASKASIEKVLVITAVEEISTTVSFYPNPVEDELIVSVKDKNTLIEAVIYAMNGKEIETKLGIGMIRIDMRSYKSGSYIMHAKSENREIRKIFVRK